MTVTAEVDSSEARQYDYDGCDGGGELGKDTAPMRVGRGVEGKWSEWQGGAVSSSVVRSSGEPRSVFC